jgi:hypothetical protein
MNGPACAFDSKRLKKTIPVETLSIAWRESCNVASQSKKTAKKKYRAHLPILISHINVTLIYEVRTQAL